MRIANSTLLEFHRQWNAFKHGLWNRGRHFNVWWLGFWFGVTSCSWMTKLGDHFWVTGVYSSWIPRSPGYNPALSSLSQVSRFRRLYQLAASSKKKHIRDLKAELEGKVDSCLSRSYMSFYVLWCVCILGHARRIEGHKNERCQKNPCDTFKPCLVFASKDFTPGAHHPDDEEGEFEHEEDIGEDAASSTVATLSELCLPVPGINWV